jgi:hypothetical protein
MTVEELLAQLGVSPGGMGLGPPAATRAPQRPYVPFDTSQIPGLPPGLPGNAPPGAANLGGPPPGGGQGAYPPAIQAILDQEEAAGITGGRPNTFAGGFAPQPRPPLPGALTQPQGADMFGGFRDRYNPQTAAQDPIAALLGSPPSGPGGMAAAPPDRSLNPPWMGGAAVGPPRPLSPAEQTLLRRSPAYGRAIQRMRDLDRLRAQRGM